VIAASVCEIFHRRSREEMNVVFSAVSQKREAWERQDFEESVRARYGEDGESAGFDSSLSVEVALNIYDYTRFMDQGY
jgi:hypothetical protein